MKTMKKITLVIALAAITMLSIGQTNEEVTKMLLNPEVKMLIMDQISNDVTMSKEMISKIMDGSRADMAMRHNMMSGMMNACMADTAMRHHMVSKMMESCKADSTMRNCMMAGMMDACKSDSAMMKSMNRHMMGKPEMKDRKDQKIMQGPKSKAVEGLDKTTLTITKKNQ
jgi:hypothetical protein